MANTYREHVLEHLLASIAPLAPLERALDFGAGDGWFAERLMATGSVREVVAVDVKPRSHSFVEPTIYDGRRLPFDDRQFDLVYSVDVIHHSDSPEATLRDALRCSREHYVLRLYVTGMTPRSTRAVENVRAICEEHLQGRYDLEVIDIYQQPILAKGEQIIAAPTLIKKLPLPLRRVIGDLSSTERVLLGLDIRPV